VGSLFESAEDPQLLRKRIAEVRRIATLRKDWQGVALVRAIDVAGRNEFFTTDPVWAMLAFDKIPPPGDERELGHVMRELTRIGAIADSGRPQVKSRRPECHGRKITVWHSLIVEGP
jgi:hypothetical protein